MKIRLRDNIKKIMKFIVIIMLMITFGCNTQPLKSNSSSPNSTNTKQDQYEGISYDSMDIEVKSLSDFPDYSFKYNFLEDSKGLLHCICYVGYRELHHFYFDSEGNRSKDEKIVNKASSFNMLISADGDLCVVYVDVDQKDQKEIRSKSYINGKWIDSPEVFELGKYTEVPEIMAAFNANRNLEYLYYEDYLSYASSSEERMGWYFNGARLTSSDNRGEARTLVNGIGSMAYPISGTDSTSYPKFMIDSQNVYHLFYFDGSNLQNDDVPNAYMHSYSKDGGKTWEGPFTIWKGLGYPTSASIVTDNMDNICIAINNRSGPELTLYTLKHDDYRISSFKTYYLGHDPFGPNCKSMKIDSDGTMYFLAQVFVEPIVIGNTDFITRFDTFLYFAKLKKDETWKVTTLNYTPSLGFDFQDLILRRNGNTFIYGEDKGYGLRYVEIPR